MKERIKHIPELLTSKLGENISNSSQWETERRPELLELFREQVYGVESVQRPHSLSFKVTEMGPMMEGKAIRKLISISYEGPGGKGTINLVLFVPLEEHRPVPVFLLANNRSANNIDPDRNIKSSFWPAENIINRGYAAAAFSVEEVDPDKYDGFKDGVHGIFDPLGIKRPSNAWGTISAWAWGASRVMDYFETDSDIDKKRVAIVGHSRGGKTALWCGAQDERFAMVVSNNSGSTGAAIARGKEGERIKDINSTFPHWFCDNYKKFNEREQDLPVDQHMLLALIAPRLLYVTSATEDSWSDPEAEFLSCTLAEPVYKLYGHKGLETQHMPCPDLPILGDHMGYHLRTGKHDLTEFDWNAVMDFADKYMKL